MRIKLMTILPTKKMKKNVAMMVKKYIKKDVQDDARPLNTAKQEHKMGQMTIRQQRMEAAKKSLSVKPKLLP